MPGLKVLDKPQPCYHLINRLAFAMQNFRVEREQPRSAEPPAAGGQRGHYAIIFSQSLNVSLPLYYLCHPYAGH